MPRPHQPSVLDGIRVVDAAIAGRAIIGDAPSFASRCTVSARQLQRRDIQGKIAKPRRFNRPLLVQLIFDESGSMHGGNDVMGHRIEACLIALEIMAPTNKGRLGVQVISFDVVAPFHLGPTKLDKSGLKLAEEVLMSKSNGGSSNLLPSLAHANRTWGSKEGWAAEQRLVVVLSDFELYDRDVTSVLHLFNETEDRVLAVVFSQFKPPDLNPDHGSVVLIDAARDQPHKIAGAIVDAANDLAVDDPSSEPRQWGRR
jgi:Mg-chelatase subunit ChlD